MKIENKFESEQQKLFKVAFDETKTRVISAIIRKVDEIWLHP